MQLIEEKPLKLKTKTSDPNNHGSDRSTRTVPSPLEHSTDRISGAVCTAL